MQVTVSTANVYCVYGFPDENLRKELLKWIEEEENRFLVILDEEEPPDPEFEMDQVRICNPSKDEGLKQIAWEMVFLSFDYCPHPGNRSKTVEQMEKAFARLSFYQEGVHLVASDYEQRGLNLLANLVKNGAALKKARRADALFGAFKDVPAVICGAGPSMEKEIAQLHRLKDQALIFAGGTALSALSKFQLLPHFAAMIDPHPPSRRFFEHQAFEVPTFFQSRVHPELLKMQQAPLLWTPGSGNDFFEKETFDGGWNVSTFLTALACHLGCNPILLVGVDLAQSQERAYVGDLERSEGGELIPVAGKEGLFTRRDWLFAGQWLEEFAAKHPEVEWLRSEKGLEIAHFKKISLSEISFEKQGDLQGDIYRQIQPLKQGIEQEMDIETFASSMGRVAPLIEQMIALLEKLFPTQPEKNAEYLLLELEIEKESAFEAFLKPIWEVWKYVFQRNLPKDIPAAYGTGLNQWLFMKGICDDARAL
jgi:hypothetical protein